MDAQTIRAIHRYGAISSVAATLGAAFLIVVGWSAGPVLFFLGFFGPLCGFYFVGGVLEEHPKYRVLGEELMRGVVWYGGSLFGWSFIISSSPILQASPATTLGLPAVTALLLSLGMVVTRRVTGLDLKVQSGGGQLLVIITGAIVGGFIILYSVLVGDRSALLALVYILATVTGLFLWWRYRSSGELAS